MGETGGSPGAPATGPLWVPYSARHRDVSNSYAGLTNLLSVRTYGELEFWLALLKVASITAFILLGIGFIAFFGPTFAHTYQTLTGDGGVFPHGLTTVLTAIPIVIFSMMGSEVATIAAVESTRPAENIARAVRTVALRILIFYVLSIAVVITIVPWRTLPVGFSPFIVALNAMHIRGAAPVMSVIVLTAVLSCLNSGIYITSRMLHELAKSGDAPQSFAATAGNRVPRRGILLGSLVGFLAAILFDQLQRSFLNNPGLNGLIVGALLLGIIYAYRQVFRLYPEIRWVNAFRIADPGLAISHRPVLLSPMAAMLGIRIGMAGLLGARLRPRAHDYMVRTVPGKHHDPDHDPDQRAHRP